MKLKGKNNFHTMHLEVVHLVNSVVHPVGIDSCDPCSVSLSFFYLIENEKLVIEAL